MRLKSYMALARYLVVALLYLPHQTVEAQLVEAPTPETQRVWENLRRVELRMMLDKSEYLPGERAYLRVIIKNATDRPVEIPLPFDTVTGSCYIEKAIQDDSSTVAGSNEASQQFAMINGADFSPYSARWSVPTVILSPGEERRHTLISTESNTWGYLFHIPTLPGHYRVSYGYDRLRINATFHANFIVIKPTKVSALQMLSLPKEEIMDHSTNARIWKSLTVPFLAIETEDGNHLIIRGDPTEEMLLQHFYRDNSLYILRYIHFFETVARVDEEVRSIESVYRADDTVDLTINVAGRPVFLRVEARLPRLRSVPR